MKINQIEAIVYQKSGDEEITKFLFKDNVIKIKLLPQYFFDGKGGVLQSDIFEKYEFVWISHVFHNMRGCDEELDKLAERKKHLAKICADGMNKVWIKDQLEEKLDKILK